MIRELIHKEDPYRFFDEGDLPDDLQGWGGHPEFFREMVNESKARCALEVGTWKGRSAVAIASAMADRAGVWNLDEGPELTCVDTWLGATEFYDDFEDKTRYASLNLKHGYPQVYYQFLTNVKRRGLETIVTPFAQSSVNALRFLAKYGAVFDLIYVDGSHEYDDVMQDLTYAWPLLKKGGIIIGDDYCEHWNGVVKAVDQFFGFAGRDVEHRQYPGEKYPSDYWIVRK